MNRRLVVGFIGGGLLVWLIGALLSSPLHYDLILANYILLFVSWAALILVASWVISQVRRFRRHS
jgi:hypothetical protein